MSYVTPADVRLVLAGSENNPGTAASLSDADIQVAINEAQAEVDGRLEGSHSTPYTSAVPPLVVNVTRDIAAYLATLTYRRGAPLLPGDPVLLRYQRAQTQLLDVAAGKITVPSASGTSGDTDPAAGSVAVVNQWTGDLWCPQDFDLTTQPRPSWPGPW